MKNFKVVQLLLCISFFSLGYGIEKQVNPQFSPYYAYCVVKNFIQINYNMLFGYIDEKKIKTSCLYCVQCHTKISSISIASYFSAAHEQSFFDTWMRVGLNGTEQEFNEFLLQACQDAQMPCFRCAWKYHGWSLTKIIIES